MAYGIIHTEAGRQAAQIADQILRGANPGDLPVQTAESYLGINLVTAQAIGVEIPADFLQQAEIVIRSSD
jgi:putative ABC transport system substrate-binding protein